METTERAAYGALVLRLALGAMFVAHGFLKVFVFTLPGTVGFFESIGLPGFLAYVVTAAEVAGGIALILGVCTRTVALALIPVLLGAVYVHAGNGWVFSAEGGGWEYPLFLAAAALAQSLVGPGKFALALPVMAGRTQSQDA
jgi:putative oxidoreductase